MELIGPYLVACVLLIGAGIAKAVRPDDTARAIVDTLPSRVPLRVPAARRLIRVGAVAEAVLGLVAMLVPGVEEASLVAVSYGVFAVVILVVRSRDGAIASCGCFGTPDTPATVLHGVIDVLLCVVASVVAASGWRGSIPALLSVQPMKGVPLVAVSLLCAWLTYLAISVLSVLEGTRRQLGIER